MTVINGCDYHLDGDNDLNVLNSVATFEPDFLCLLTLAISVESEQHFYPEYDGGYYIAFDTVAVFAPRISIIVAVHRLRWGC